MNKNCKSCDNYLRCLVGEYQTLFKESQDIEIFKYSQICEGHARDYCPKLSPNTSMFANMCGIKGCVDNAKYIVNFDK